jgi:hypothetical protein
MSYLLLTSCISSHYSPSFYLSFLQSILHIETRADPFKIQFKSCHFSALNREQNQDIYNKISKISRPQKMPRNKFNEGNESPFNENYKSLKKEIKEDIKKMERSPMRIG